MVLGLNTGRLAGMPHRPVNDCAGLITTGAQAGIPYTHCMTETWPIVPEPLPSEEQRQKAITGLNQAWQSGQITAEEFNQRVRGILDAQSLTEVEQVAPPPNQLEPVTHTGEMITDSWDSESRSRVPARWAPEEAVGRAASIAILGGSTLAGNWTLARNLWNLTVMGGSVIDLQEAEFTAPVTVITVGAFWGGVEIIVPPDLNVEVQGTGIMGGFDWNSKKAAAHKVDPDGPKVIIRGIALMAGVEIKRKRRFKNDDKDEKSFTRRSDDQKMRDRESPHRHTRDRHRQEDRRRDETHGYRESDREDD